MKTESVLLINSLTDKNEDRIGGELTVNVNQGLYVEKIFHTTLTNLKTFTSVSSALSI